MKESKEYVMTMRQLYAVHNPLGDRLQIAESCSNKPSRLSPSPVGHRR